ncbi:prostaglandin E synthase isoform X2 [Protopterus annectens]|uniref:prostaglandin E synthase isoform X2 n=1 Tax=Protopterus annectens TaxID=7888 RepID=UPI001CFA877B|nr:prostaglandin E synthase isoform X2 [Protopterus annectens]
MQNKYENNPKKFWQTINLLLHPDKATTPEPTTSNQSAFANPEDAMRHGGLQYHRDDATVERYRRAHRNDMENIFPFLFLGAIYSLLGPNLLLARIHFLVFFIFRIVHTVAYLFALRAPIRSVAYSIAQLPCFSMALQILTAVINYC